MKIVFIFFFLLFNFQFELKADQIEDYEMDNMMVGDSLLEHYNSNELQIALESATYYPKSKK